MPPFSDQNLIIGSPITPPVSTQLPTYTKLATETSPTEIFSAMTISPGWNEPSSMGPSVKPRGRADSGYEALFYDKRHSMFHIVRESIQIRCATLQQDQLCIFSKNARVQALLLTVCCVSKLILSHTHQKAVDRWHR